MKENRPLQKVPKLSTVMIIVSAQISTHNLNRESYPLLISTGFLKYPVSLDNFSISKFSV